MGCNAGLFLCCVQAQGLALTQDLCLQERVDGGQAAVLIAGPPSADSVTFILDSCEEVEASEGAGRAQEGAWP